MNFHPRNFRFYMHHKLCEEREKTQKICVCSLKEKIQNKRKTPQNKRNKEKPQNTKGKITPTIKTKLKQIKFFCCFFRNKLKRFIAL